MSVDLSRPVQQKIEEVAKAAGFTSIGRDCWAREHEWRTDQIDLEFKKMYFTINLYVNIPPIPNTRFEFTTLAFKNLPTLCGDSDSVYRYPPSAVHRCNLIEKIEQDLKQGLGWFENFRSPQQCLEFLRNDKSKNPASEMFRHCLAHLEHAIAKAEK